MKEPPLYVIQTERRLADRETLHRKSISWWQRLKFHLCAQIINQACKRIINRAHERGTINSEQLKTLLGITDRALFPHVRK